MQNSSTTATAAFTSVNVTLSRAHKIGERIGALMAKTRATIDIKASAVPTSQAPSAALIERLKQEMKNIVENIVLFESLANTQAALRTKIAESNAREVSSGAISKTLADVEALKKRIDLLELLEQHAPALNTKTVHELQALVDNPQPVVFDNDSARPRGNNVLVSPLETAVVAKWSTKKSVLEQNLFSLMDKLADLNAQRITIDIPNDLIAQLGLAK